MTVLSKVEKFTRKIYEVKATLPRKAGAGRMTILFAVEDFTRKICKVTCSPQDDNE